MANPTPVNTYEIFQFLDESKSLIKKEKKLKLIIKTTGGNYEDFCVYKRISAIKFELESEVYDLCTILVDDGGQIRFPSNIFETIQKAFEKDYCMFYTLVAIITKILNSNMIYLKYSCVTSPTNLMEDCMKLNSVLMKMQTCLEQKI